jgi:hypothetical protein
MEDNGTFEAQLIGANWLILDNRRLK